MFNNLLIKSITYITQSRSHGSSSYIICCPYFLISTIYLLYLNFHFILRNHLICNICRCENLCFQVVVTCMVALKCLFSWTYKCLLYFGIWRLENVKSFCFIIQNWNLGLEYWSEFINKVWRHHFFIHRFFTNSWCLALWILWVISLSVIEQSLDWSSISLW